MYNSFSNRHIGISSNDLASMLETIGISSLDALINETIPANIQDDRELSIPAELSEADYLSLVKEKVSKNQIFKNYIGLGYYDTIVPSVILRNIFENPGWYTQYTPYQAEISQGRLEALLNFQTMVMSLTGFDIANASLLDEGTAGAEAMTLLHRARGKEKKKAEANQVLVHSAVFSQTKEILKTRAIPLGLEIIETNDVESKLGDKVFAVFLQYPDTKGEIADFSPLISACNGAEISVAMACDIMSLALLKSPASLGASCAFGSTQRFGVPMGFGGPHAAYLATKQEFKRDLAGRVIGVSVDSRGKSVYRMALQTREQHIRREKATSNICTAQALLAIMASMYAVYHGSEGIKAIAKQIHSHTTRLRDSISDLGFEILNVHFFDTLTINAGSIGLAEIRKAFEAKKINLRYDESSFGISLSEKTSFEDVEEIISILANLKGLRASALKEGELISIGKQFLREDEILEHPVFSMYHSETEMMRYLKRLENKDLSLTTSMIPLGSCTMKLNAASEMIPISWPEIANLHPFAPKEQFLGYQEMFAELEYYLAEITGLVATSLQPNSGAQGEFAGLMVIRAYHEEHNQLSRNICLIPSSAHGTNPASAIMAGLQVVVIKCDDEGNIDVEDLKAKCEKYSANLAALMITYPSTHGVFEESVKNICSMVHDHGGLVYMDGANMNALVGLTSPGYIGADVCHLNLHKTFSIPHGGGGPGIGPICVNDKLKPFLPGHEYTGLGDTKSVSAISAAPWGSASILFISYGYIRMLGKVGVREASRYAILNANYIKSRLEKAYQVLYTGDKNRVAHELIIDLREFKQSANVSVEDVAKRLIDYGFHAPTMSWPVAGTIMIEPTESESKSELDRFCDAMLAIREEIEEIISGRLCKEDNPLLNAPHTIEYICSENFSNTYSRERAVYPLDYLKQYKYWVPVSRVDNTYGDRNLVCACPPLESYLS